MRRIVVDGLERRQPGQASANKRSRPDRARALTHATGYDRWVHAKVQASRDSTNLAKPRKLIAHENCIVYFDRNEDQCVGKVHTVVHVARITPTRCDG